MRTGNLPSTSSIGPSSCSSTNCPARWVSVRAELASELADSYGMIGGIERRWGLSLDGTDRQRHLEHSCGRVRPGFSHEQDLDPHVASTYNRINRLVGRVLLNPHVLDDTTTSCLDVTEELGKAHEILVEQLRSARREGSMGVLRSCPDPAPPRRARRAVDLLRARTAYVLRSSSMRVRSRRSSRCRRWHRDLRTDLPTAVAQLQRAARYAAG